MLYKEIDILDDKHVKKRGRPYSGPPKVKKVTLKMSEDEFNELTNIGKKTGKSKSDIIRKGIQVCKSLADCNCSLDLD